MTVTIGIPTYNRKDLLRIMATSLYESDLSMNHNIRIYDDRSVEYGIDELREIFPTAVSIKRNEINLKADKNMYQMYSDFIKTGDDYFFNADSDILFNKDWLNKSMKLAAKTQGVLSLFNAASHKTYKEIDDNLVLKKDVGAAGTLFTKERMLELLRYFNSMDKVKGFDWQWCEYFTGNNVPIFCVKESLVQHIGYTGQNVRYFFDFGRNYKIQSIREGQIVNDIFEKTMDNILEIDTTRIKIEKEREKLENSFLYHLRRCLAIAIKLIIPEKLYQMMKRKIGSKKNGTYPNSNRTESSQPNKNT
ncbi:MAG: glycosyltransferase family 2 protein [Treponema sp.]|jgi:hypothetical protein|nr:glycosyltransferase family 2 protein [Treponema sp.]